MIDKVVAEHAEDTWALVTGASRGIGACVAELLAKRNANVVINYRSKAPRAEKVARLVEQQGQNALLAQADICIESDVVAMFDELRSSANKLDILVLNASGGMEKDKSSDYAMILNHDAQLRLADLALPLMKKGGRIVFVTSHLAHFYGQKPVYEAYENVAKSKNAGEHALRNRVSEFAEKNVSLVVVSGDLIEGTITPKLMARSDKGIIERRKNEAGYLPSVDDFAEAIAVAAFDPLLNSGDTVYVGYVD